MLPAPESNGFMKKLYSVHGWVLQGLSLVCAACTLLVSFGCSILWASHLQGLSLPSVGSLVLGQSVGL